MRSFNSSTNFCFQYNYDKLPLSGINSAQQISYSYLSDISFNKPNSGPLMHPYKKTIINRYYSYWLLQTDNQAKHILNPRDFKVKLKIIQNRMKKSKPLMDFDADFVLCNDTVNTIKTKTPCLKCSYCNQEHQLYKCKKYSQDKVTCSACSGLGHTLNECLKYSIKNIIADDLTGECLKCGKEGHLYCTFTSNRINRMFMKAKDEVYDDNNDIPMENLVSDINNTQLKSFSSKSSKRKSSDDLDNEDSKKQQKQKGLYEFKPSTLLLNKNFYDEEDDLSL